MKIIKLIAISLVGIFMLSGCGLANSQNPGDLQGTNKTDIVGTVIKLTKNQSGEILGTILVEGEKGSKPYDQASIKVTQKTKINEKSADNVVNSNFDALQENLKVEVRFIGPVAESYPVQATADEITILKDEQADTDKRPSIGQIQLGDSQSQVNEILGSVFKEEYHEEPGHFPESWNKRTYDKGVTVIVGKDSGQVLEIETTSAQFPTNRGSKIGDIAKDVFDNYGSDYKQLESRHGEGKLAGFYDLGDGQLIIFDLDKDDNSLLNQDVKADSKVEMIRLTNSNFLD
ncbi:DUF3221 domain-containing protein [Desulfosporosinus nitroreducens]|uniref:DUF3221 domain-containing protein n=1 Tax=Desulfosporosinus nitroreducens TaxID=2018668 RepID=UPI00207CD6E0|nr:DUF3221 domain-containing protein [Desulfosporosinus nitroreducens]MCO1603528.1 YobA family protein [Desulfosporosinus nitroreducens]